MAVQKEQKMYSQMIIIKPYVMKSDIILSEDVFPRLHQLFVDNGCKFGVSFPAYSFKEHGELGNIVEILCEDETALRELNLGSHFTDVEEVKVMNDIHKTEDYTLFHRVREKARTGRYAKRMMMRGNELPSGLYAHIQRHNKRIFAHAFIMMKSASTQQKFTLFVEPIEARTAQFNAYGLAVRGQEEKACCQIT